MEEADLIRIKHKHDAANEIIEFTKDIKRAIKIVGNFLFLFS